MFTACCGRGGIEETSKTDRGTQCDNNVLKTIGVSQTFLNFNDTVFIEKGVQFSPILLKNRAKVRSENAATTEHDNYLHDMNYKELGKVENGDEEVFREGVGPPMVLTSNLGTPYPKKREDYVSLPRWFSEEDDQEIGGIQEPPATPIGKDELALKRHRFFSDLLNAARSVTEHKVRFDPLGPVVAGGENVFY